MNTVGASRIRRTGGVLLGLAALVGSHAGAQSAAQPLDERESYAFVRTMEGEAVAVSAGQGVGEAVRQNQPLLTGDRLITEGDSRLEVVLPDRNRLTVGRGSSVRLDRLAYSGDEESRVTVLNLESGEILLRVTDEALGDELPRIDAAAGTVFVQEPGLYRVTAERDGWLQVLVREGYAELVTDHGSTIVRAGEAAETGADRSGRVRIAEAGRADDLERWSEDRFERAGYDGGSARYLDSSVAYASDDLDENGDWISYQNVNYWRPRVSVGWRPYWNGGWGWTPSGYTWISYEPWGWVPYHYGRWSIVPGYGWAWHPGYVYSPAWVYWYWNDGYAGWCPTGYYTNYYSPWYRGGFHFGYYGWAGGSWGYYNHWNFAPVHCFRDRRWNGHLRTGHGMQLERRWTDAPRGLITTDTRDFGPNRIGRGDFLRTSIREGEGLSRTGTLPDVTDFVGRKPDLPPTVVNAIAASPGKPAIRLNDPERVASAPGWRAEGGGKNVGRAPGLDRGANRGGSKGEIRAESPVDTRRGVVQDSKGNTGGNAGGRGAVVRDNEARGSEPRVVKPRSESPVEGRISGGGKSDSRQGWKDKSESGSRIGGGKADSGNAAQRISRTPQPVVRDEGPKVVDRRSSAPVARVIDGTRRSVSTPKPEDGSASGSSSRSIRSYPDNSKSSRGYERQADSAPRASERYQVGNGRSAAPTYTAPRSSGRVEAQSSAPRTYRSAAPQVSRSAPPNASRSTASAPSGGARSSGGGSPKASAPSRGGGSSNGAKSSGGSAKSSGGASSKSSSGSTSSQGNGKSKDR